MSGKFEDSEEKKGKIILLLVFIGLVLLFAFFIYSRLAVNKTQEEVDNSDNVSARNASDEDNSVSQYFTMSEFEDNGVKDIFYKDDPFKGVCGAVGDNVPNVSSNTVCLR